MSTREERHAQIINEIQEQIDETTSSKERYEAEVAELQSSLYQLRDVKLPELQAELASLQALKEQAQML